MLKKRSNVSVRRKGNDIIFQPVEHYVRDDIESPLVSTAKRYHIIPDGPTAADYIDVWEHCTTSGQYDVEGIIFLQSTLRWVQSNRDRHVYNRLKSLTARNANDKHDESNRVSFSNECFVHTFVDPCDADVQSIDLSTYNPKTSSSISTYERILTYRAAAWYAISIVPAGHQVIVVSTDTTTLNLKDKICARFTDLPAVPDSLSMVDFISTWCRDYPALLELYTSLAAVVDTTNDDLSGQRHASGKQASNAYAVVADPATGYSAYIPDAAAEAGVRSGVLFSGILHVSKYHSTEAVVRVSAANAADDDDTNPTGETILVLGDAHRNRAVHGDAVVVRLLPRTQWSRPSGRLHAGGSHATEDSAAASPTHGTTSNDAAKQVMRTGHVIAVSQRNWRAYVATLQDGEVERHGGSKVLAVPMDARIPKIRFATSNKSALAGQRIVLRIHAWPVASRWPEGHFVTTIGPADTLEAETKIILHENQIRAGDFSAGVHKEMPVDTPENPWTPSAEEISKRRDIRASHLIFSIDPLGCEDVDDALGVMVLPNGNVELSVHIADVTHFVQEGSFTDAEARSRGTTVYLCDRRYDMLPVVLSANLCSLHAGVDRYAMSVFWELNADCTEVLSVEFGKSIIRSSYELHYELAQAIAERSMSTAEIIRNVPSLQSLPAASATARIDEVRVAVCRLMNIAQTLKKQRVGVGALDLSSDEIRVKLDSHHKSVVDLVAKKGLAIHETVAECMIFANRAVAEKISTSFAKCSLLRRHPLPTQAHFAKLIAAAALKGHTIATTSNLALAASLDAAIDPNDPSYNDILRKLATAAMSEAEYFDTGVVDAADWDHYGLGVPRYTHFTSPIRRYADCIVHRQLVAAIAAEHTPARDRLVASSALTAVAQHINEKNRASKIAQRESLQLFQTLYFTSDAGRNQVIEAIVVDIKDNGFIAYSPRYGIKGPIYLCDKDNRITLPREFIRRCVPAQVQHFYLQSSDAEGSEEDSVVVDGLLTVHEPARAGLTVTMAAGGVPIAAAVAFHMFDRVAVRVGVQPSLYHRARVHMRLVDRVAGGAGPGRTGGHAHMVQTVRGAGLPHSTPSALSGTLPRATGTPSTAGVGTTVKAAVSDSMYDIVEHFKAMAVSLECDDDAVP
eukprot:m.1428829 g.1428829  ORF g.1428829 m.1428829 type:complete len:1137 (+) comp25068_c0_seq3:205-3615(+)